MESWMALPSPGQDVDVWKYEQSITHQGNSIKCLFFQFLLEISQTLYMELTFILQPYQ